MSLERAIASLADIVQLQSQSIDRLSDRIEQSNDRTNAVIERLTVQVGSFSSSIIELKALSRQILTAIEGERAIAMQQAQNIERQSENIAELIALAKQQQQTVDRLLGSATK